MQVVLILRVSWEKFSLDEVSAVPFFTDLNYNMF